MIASILRIASLVATAILIVSFGLFVVDETSNGSKQQIARLAADAGTAGQPSGGAATDVNQANPSDAVARERARRHGQPRETIDKADDVLVSPFAGIVHSSSIWVQRGVPTLIALLIFGFGLRLLSNYATPARR